jgi:hypothetical protein
MCPNENIVIPEDLQITNKNYQNSKDPFIVKVKVFKIIFISFKNKPDIFITLINLIFKDK